MKLSKQIEHDVLAEHQAAKAGNSGNHYYYKQLSYRALAEVDRLNELVQELTQQVTGGTEMSDQQDQTGPAVDHR